MMIKEVKKIDKKNVDQMILNAKASLAIEELKVKIEEVEVVRKYFNGEYTEKEVLEIIKNS